MPSTAEQEVQALRVVFGAPKDPRSVEHMEGWLKKHCRDYRRHDEGDNVVAAMVLHEPMKGQALRDLLAHHVRRWGFKRRSHARGQLEFLTIDSYMMGPIGPLMQEKVKKLLTSIYEGPQHQSVPLPKGDPLRKARAKALAGKIAKVLDKKLKPTLTSVFKRFWTNAHNQIYNELVQKGEDPTKSKKKLAVASWWDKDAYDKNGKRTGRPSQPFDGF